MKQKTPILLFLAVLLLCLLALLTVSVPKDVPSLSQTPVAEDPIPPSSILEDTDQAAALADRIQADSVTLPETVIPSPSSPTVFKEPVSVKQGEVLYAYEGMTVHNNGGTVYSTGAEVQNDGGTVFCDGGTVHNRGGMVYAKSGTVFTEGGTVYNKGADVLVLGDEGTAESRIFGYYELKFADYYEPFVTVEGVTTEPGSELLIISEDSVCRVTPKAGYRIVSAESESGELIWDQPDGSVSLQNVTEDTTLKLEIGPA